MRDAIADAVGDQVDPFEEGGGDGEAGEDGEQVGAESESAIQWEDIAGEVAAAAPEPGLDTEDHVGDDIPANEGDQVQVGPEAGAPEALLAPPGRIRRSTISDILTQVSAAVFFPQIGWAGGELLRLALPLSWTLLPPQQLFWFRPQAKGLLQQTWGRSIVGGCMFIVMKDMFQLYVKYRRAAIHASRRVKEVPRQARLQSSMS